MSSEETSEGGLKRELNFWDATILIVGLVIGGSIFLTPGSIARDLPSAPAILTVWIAGGLLTIAGGLVYAELGAMMPRAGGMYVYLREAYGPLAGFLYGWLSCFVICSGTASAVAVGFAEYLSVFFPRLGTARILASPLGVHISAGQLVAVAAILVLSATHYWGIRQGTRIQAFFTLLIVVTMIGLAAGGIAFPRKTAAGAAHPALFSAAGVSAAMIAVLWAYYGWSDIVAAAGEIRRPQRNIPLALFAGTGIVTLLYVGVVAAYLKVLPIAELATTARPAGTAAVRLFGAATASIIAASIVSSAFGCTSASLVAGPRIGYAMAKDGLFFPAFGKVHPRFGTPGFALAVQAVWSSLLCLSGRYDELYTYVTFAVILAYAATGASLFLFRARRPELARPYRCWGYPVVPAIFIASSLFVAVSTVAEKPRETLAGLAILALGVPIYYGMHRGLKGVPQ